MTDTIKVAINIPAGIDDDATGAKSVISALGGTYDNAVRNGESTLILAHVPERAANRLEDSAEKHGAFARRIDC